jgi:hypothetical protein
MPLICAVIKAGHSIATFHNPSAETSGSVRVQYAYQHVKRLSAEMSDFESYENPMYSSNTGFQAALAGSNCMPQPCIILILSDLLARSVGILCSIHVMEYDLNIKWVEEGAIDHHNRQQLLLHLVDQTESSFLTTPAFFIPSSSHLSITYLSTNPTP